MTESDGSADRVHRTRRARGWDFEANVPWEDVIESMRQGVPVLQARDSPPVREAHCQCCGGFAGHGPDPSHCSACREDAGHAE